MSTNITTAYKKDSGDIIVATAGLESSMVNRIVAIHANAVTVAGTFDIKDVNGSRMKFDVGVSGTADIYMGDMGVRFDGTVSVSAPSDGSSVTLILG